jgi:acyl-ACP thioesterase
MSGAPEIVEFDELVDQPASGRVFEWTARPGGSDSPSSGRVRVDAIARWLQDSAYADVEDAGLAEHGAWVVRRNRIRVADFPRFGEQISLRTFCSAGGTLVAERRHSISSTSGAVESVGLWVHIDPSSGLPARLGEEIEAVYSPSAGGRRARSRLRHPPPAEGSEQTPWHFRAADVDLAGHVNNAVYWEIAEELIARGEEPETLDIEIEFREPAQPGDATLLTAPGWAWVVGAKGEVHASIGGLPEVGSGQGAVGGES